MPEKGSTEHIGQVINPIAALSAQPENSSLQPEKPVADTKSADRPVVFPKPMRLAGHYETGQGAVEKFAREWNRRHEDIKFAVGGTINRRPTEIKLRFDAQKYLGRCSIYLWSGLDQQLGMRSHRSLVLMSSERELMLGIMDLAVACVSEAYSDEAIIATLSWLGKDLIPSDELRSH